MITILFATLRPIFQKTIDFTPPIVKTTAYSNSRFCFSGSKQFDKCELIPLQWFGAQESRWCCASHREERFHRCFEDQEKPSKKKTDFYIQNEFAQHKMMFLITESHMIDYIHHP